MSEILVHQLRDKLKTILSRHRKQAQTERQRDSDRQTESIVNSMEATIRWGTMLWFGFVPSKMIGSHSTRPHRNIALPTNTLSACVFLFEKYLPVNYQNHHQHHQITYLRVHSVAQNVVEHYCRWRYYLCPCLSLNLRYSNSRKVFFFWTNTQYLVIYTQYLQFKSTKSHKITKKTPKINHKLMLTCCCICCCCSIEIWAAAIWALADFLLFSSLKQWFFWCRINS